MDIGPIHSRHGGLRFEFSETEGKTYWVTIPRELLDISLGEQKDWIAHEMWVASHIGHILRSARIKIAGYGAHLRPYDLVDVKEKSDAD